MSKPSFHPIAPLDVDDAALERVNDRLGVPTMVRPASKSALPSPVATARQEPRPSAAAGARPQEKLTVELPGYLMDAMKQEALNRRTSVRHLVMIGLQKMGLAISPEDLVPDARRSTNKVRIPVSQ
jgi:hypothetical protein